MRDRQPVKRDGDFVQRPDFIHIHHRVLERLRIVDRLFSQDVMGQGHSEALFHQRCRLPALCRSD